MPWKSSVCMLSKGDGTYITMGGILEIVMHVLEIDEET